MFSATALESTTGPSSCCRPLNAENVIQDAPAGLAVLDVEGFRESERHGLPKLLDVCQYQLPNISVSTHLYQPGDDNENAVGSSGLDINILLWIGNYVLDLVRKREIL